MRDIFTPSLIWDLALIAVILFVMIRSVGRGFVSSFIHLLGLAAACIVAALLSGKAAAWLYDGYLAERLQTAVSDTLRQKLQTFAELLDRIDPTDTITGAAGDALRTVMVALLTMVVFLVIFLISYKLADYTRFIIYSLAYPEEKDFIIPVDLSHLVGERKTYYTLCRTGLQFGALLSAYFFVQSLFVLGSSIWPKNSFLKTFASGTVIAIVYFLLAVFMSKMFLENGNYYSENVFTGMSEDTAMSIMIVVGIFFTLMNWTLAYLRFKESEIVNRM